MKTITGYYNYIANVDRSLIKEVFMQKLREKNTTPKISVVLATYNRDHLIVRALTAIAIQNLPQNLFEIIIVSDGSTDGTEEKIKKFIKQNTSSNIFLITLKKNLGSSYARNVGVLHAHGELIAITDDDCIVPPDWLSNFLQAFKTHPEIIAAGGFKKPYRNNEAAPSQYDTFMFWRRLPYMTTECQSVEMSKFNNCGDTANVCYKKQAFLAAGGFNHNLRTFNDWELKIRLHQLGAPLLYCPVFISHEADLNFGKFLKYWLKLGHDCFLISKIHPSVPIFNTSFKTSFRRALDGISRIIKAPKDEIFQKTIPQTLFFIFLEISINACLWTKKTLL